VKVYVVVPIEVDEDDYGDYPDAVQNVSSDVDRAVAMAQSDLNMYGPYETIEKWQFGDTPNIYTKSFAVSVIMGVNEYVAFAGEDEFDATE
jgi:hypothetical protein